MKKRSLEEHSIELKIEDHGNFYFNLLKMDK
jgi:hypothetical protein